MVLGCDYITLFFSFFFHETFSEHFVWKQFQSYWKITKIGMVWTLVICMTHRGSIDRNFKVKTGRGTREGWGWKGGQREKRSKRGRIQRERSWDTFLKAQGLYFFLDWETTKLMKILTFFLLYYTSLFGFGCPISKGFCLDLNTVGMEMVYPLTGSLIKPPAAEAPSWLFHSRPGTNSSLSLATQTSQVACAISRDFAGMKLPDSFVDKGE